VCEICGRKWQPETHEQAKRNKTCGPICAGQQISKSKSGKVKPQSEHSGKSEATCCICGEIFWRNTKWLERAEKNTCSKTCFGKLKSKQVKGEKNPSWKGGITPQNLVERAKLDDWKRAVFQRDDYRCRVCGDDRGGNLNAHHIRPFRDYREKRSVVSNGITLCKPCHDKVHYIEEESAPWFEELLEGGVDHTSSHLVFQEELARLWEEQAVTLRRLYWEENNSTTDIGRILGIDPKTVTYRMEKLGIERRSRAEGLRVRHPIPDGFSEAYLRGDSNSSLTKEFGCSVASIYAWRKRLKLPKRSNRKGAPSD
jgi:hypothetical protein